MQVMRKSRWAVSIQVGMTKEWFSHTGMLAADRELAVWLAKMFAAAAGGAAASGMLSCLAWGGLAELGWGGALLFTASALVARLPLRGTGSVCTLGSCWTFMNCWYRASYWLLQRSLSEANWRIWKSKFAGNFVKILRNRNISDKKDCHRCTIYVLKEQQRSANQLPSAYRKPDFRVQAKGKKYRTLLYNGYLLFPHYLRCFYLLVKKHK